MSYLFAFSYCSCVLKAKILKWFAIAFSSGPCFVRTIYHDLSVLGGPTGFIELVRQGCVPCDQFDYFSVIVVFILSGL